MELNGEHYGIYAVTRAVDKQRFDQSKWHDTFTRAIEVARRDARVKNLRDFYDWCEQPYVSTADDTPATEE